MFKNTNSLELKKAIRETKERKNLVGKRCSRILLTFAEIQSRQSALEKALDDSSFYVSACNTSYSFPRILIWAIPLMGFIGTVLGISQAVSSFSSILQGSTEIEQLKDGIGQITSGLAVAFDTTLWALLLSILVMIPLVMTERYEIKLLLAIDILIGDCLLSYLQEPIQSEEQLSIKNSRSLNKDMTYFLSEFFYFP